MSATGYQGRREGERAHEASRSEVRVELGQVLDSGVRFLDATHSEVMAKAAPGDAQILAQRFDALCDWHIFIRGVVVVSLC